jgi:hypothetical protein
MSDKWQEQLMKQGRRWIQQAMVESYQTPRQMQYSEEFEEYIENLKEDLIDEGRPEEEVRRLIDEEVEKAIDKEEDDCRQGKYPGESEAEWNSRWWAEFKADHPR